VVDSGDFMTKLASIKPWIVPREERSLAQGEYRQTPAQLGQFEQFSHCINCMLCYAACPQYGLDPSFMGPGVIALLHRYNSDSRDAAKDDEDHQHDGLRNEEWRLRLRWRQRRQER